MGSFDMARLRAFLLVGTLLISAMCTSMVPDDDNFPLPRVSDEGSTISANGTFGDEPQDPIPICTVLEGHEGNSSFGRGLANVGDVNGDGIDDILLQSVDRRRSANMWITNYFPYLLLGRSDRRFDLNQLQLIGRENHSSHVTPFHTFLDSCQLGDVNGDGYADVWSLPPRVLSGEVVYVDSILEVWNGSPSGLPDTPSSSVYIPSEEDLANHFTAFSAGIGDVNGDGYNYAFVYHYRSP